MIEERLINPRKPVAGHLDGRRIAQMWETQTRPRPVHRVVSQLRAHGIQQDVAVDREEMAVLLNRNTVEAALPHMAMASVVPISAAETGGGRQEKVACPLFRSFPLLYVRNCTVFVESVLFAAGFRFLLRISRGF